MPDLDLEALERDREGGYGKIQTERLIQALPALIARIRELEAEVRRPSPILMQALAATRTLQDENERLRTALSSLLLSDGDIGAEVRVIVRDRLTEAGVDWRTLAGPRKVTP